MTDRKFIAQGAILSNANTLIVCHNHPSGKCEPSTPDKSMTEDLKKGLELFDVRFYDHIIITKDGYYSFVEKGVIK